MDSTLKNALEILEFQDVAKIPKMKEVRQKWLKLSLLLHPDKQGGSKELFQSLVSAYKVVCEAVRLAEFDQEDIEEDIARKIYDQFQLSSIIENLQCYTILIESQFLDIWESVLGLSYGSPIDQSTNGKKFTFNDSCPDSGTVFITLYHTSKLLIQAQNNHHSINIHFVNNHLEDLYLQVYKRKSKISVRGLPVPDSILSKSPNFRTRSKSTSAGISNTNLEVIQPSETDGIASLPHDDEPQILCESSAERSSNFKCNVCDKEFPDQASLTIHCNDSECDQSSLINSLYGVTTIPEKSCNSCLDKILEKDLDIECNLCQKSYHKRCTELSRRTGIWKPKSWRCQFCKIQSTEPSTDLCNVSPKNVTKVSGKHKKSNILSDHPENDFLESQINSLKSVIAMREAELKKCKESNDLKSKRIMYLEEQLNQARKLSGRSTAAATFNENQNEHDLNKAAIETLEARTSTIELTL